VEDRSIQHGFMGFDRASEVYAARRFPWHPLRFPVDLPGVVEAVGNGGEIEAALPRVREVLAPGLINLAEVDPYAPGLIVFPFTGEPSRDVL
jgi:PII-like signaling protein